MIALLRKSLLAGIGLLLLLRPVLAAPAAYELLLATKSLEASHRLVEFFQRNLPLVATKPMLPAQRYREYPQFPVAACTGDEYYLIAHGMRLIAFGCLDNDLAAPELRKIRLAIDRDRETIRERSNDALLDGALHSAAAGQWSRARRYAAAMRKRPQQVAQTVLRLQRLLDRQ